MTLLQQWQNVFREVIQLSKEIESVPDECRCGDAEAHLEGRRSCCGAHERTNTPGGYAENCIALLARLRADVSILCEDFARVAGPIKVGASQAGHLELRRGVFLTANDLQQVAEAVEHLGEAVVGFRRTCAVSEMRGLKHRCAELRAHCERLDAALEGA